MSTLTMSAPFSHTGFHREFSWQPPRPTEAPQRSRPDSDRIALPSIREVLPELHLRVQPQDGPSRLAHNQNSPHPALSARALTPPEYVHTPNQNKRRRISIDDDREGERASQIPRFYASPSSAGPQLRTPPPPLSIPTPGGLSWAVSGSPVAMEVHDRSEARTNLPSVPPMTFERAAQVSRARSHSGDHYLRDGPGVRSEANPHGVQAMEAAASYRPPVYGYGYHHRTQSLSLGSAHPFEPTPFSAGPYGSHYQDNLMRLGELGMGMNGDNKQRKRRGNLPKETTDKLRAWFVAHLHHPYPTEDEKQDLMRQTGLQMNQISNWFINARRRQLPTMISNARAESDAIRHPEGKVLSSTERAEYGHHDVKHEGDSPLSDGDGGYDDVDIESLHQPRESGMECGSI